MRHTQCAPCAGEGRARRHDESGVAPSFGRQTVSASPEALALSKDLKKLGWKFVGPTTLCTFMQAVGLVNDRAEACAIHPEAERARERFERPA
ncbi:MAG: DNA-3-methyladenine glycosylase I [Solimonas sp.]